jgi:hypothetical protein
VQANAWLGFIDCGINFFAAKLQARPSLTWRDLCFWNSRILARLVDAFRGAERLDILETALIHTSSAFHCQ